MSDFSYSEINMNSCTLLVLNQEHISAFSPDSAQSLSNYLRSAQERPKNPEFYSLRFERLAQQLIQHFPLSEPSGPAVQAKSLWLTGNPVREVREKPCSAIWSPQIDPSRVQEFFQVLLPKARALFLDVMDASTGTYYGSVTGWGDGFTFPAERMDERMKLDPAFKTPLLTKPQLRKHCIKQMTMILSEHGFKAVTNRDYAIYFERDVAGGKQLVTGDFQKIQMDHTVSFSVRSLSNRYFTIEYAAEGKETDLYQLSNCPTFYNTLENLRQRSQHEWCFDGGKMARNEEELGWMIEDIVRLGLPILEKAKTIEGLDWLYHADCDEARMMYERNSTAPIRHPRDALAFLSSKIIYAWLSGNPRFEEIVERLYAHASGKHNTPQDPDYQSPRDMAEIEMYAAYCRQSVPRIGTGPA